MELLAVGAFCYIRPGFSRARNPTTAHPHPWKCPTTPRHRLIERRHRPPEHRSHADVPPRRHGGIGRPPLCSRNQGLGPVPRPCPRGVCLTGAGARCGDPLGRPLRAIVGVRAVDYLQDRQGRWAALPGALRGPIRRRVVTHVLPEREKRSGPLSLTS